MIASPSTTEMVTDEEDYGQAATFDSEVRGPDCFQVIHPS